MENKEQIDTRKNSPIIQQTFMKTELPSRLFLNRGLSSSTCCFFFLLTLYFEKINHLSAPKREKKHNQISKISMQNFQIFQWVEKEFPDGKAIPHLHLYYVVYFVLID